MSIDYKKVLDDSFQVIEDYDATVQALIKNFGRLAVQVRDIPGEANAIYSHAEERMARLNWSESKRGMMRAMLNSFLLAVASTKGMKSRRRE